MAAKRQTPKFTGIDTHRDRLGRFSVRFPSDWQQLDLEGRDGLVWLPDPADPATSLSVWAEELPHHVVAEDLPQLSRGLADGLAAQSKTRIEDSSDVVLGNLIKLERVFTFREGAATRKRHVWLLYVDKWLIVVTFQGSSPEEYAHWEAMANYCFATFNVPEALWFATDRDLLARAQGGAEASPDLR